jgi:hypothetical protein
MTLVSRTKRTSYRDERTEVTASSASLSASSGDKFALFAACSIMSKKRSRAAFYCS